ncbi:HD domain-containing protein [Deinococcus sp. KNUC1210]|uniref:HD domain-containing protein n=1 Tax=Deinococcus sp. KNUC1210 TaxID=2917691 RepID=UPI001EEFBFC4|nr:HD domain-containing protein [Deinococcus sp. KNUC1210]ULH14334.1 HD domain-containing protein [Deinococcus sp. KNUC1210]
MTRPALPTRQQAEALLLDAEAMNPGPWAAHSRFVAQAAAAIAAEHPDLDPQRAFVLGLLHDFGRRTGPNRDRHILDGYDGLSALGHHDAARIALTHSFPRQQMDDLLGAWDGTEQEWKRLATLLAGVQYTEEDRLIQLCDLLALPQGCCILEQRLVDIARRYGLPPQTLPKWEACFALKTHFDAATGNNIYRLLPGLVEMVLG